MAWCTVSIDGYSSGPGGPEHDNWLYEHVMRPGTGEYFEGIWRGCDTALLGRNNYLGFHAVWPGITADPATDPRTRDLGRWLCSVGKGVVSVTLPEQEATWDADPVHAGGRLVDDLRLAVAPVLLGGGLRLQPDGVSGAWDLASSTTLPDGALGLHYQRR